MSKTMRVLIPTAILIFSLVGAVILVLSKPDVKTAPTVAPRPLVRVQNLQPETVTMLVKSQGTVMPRTQSSLVSQVAGRVVSVAPGFAAGGFFEKGDVLVEIDRRDYELALTQAKAQVAQAAMRLKLEKQEAEIAQKEWQRLGKNGTPPDLVLRKPQLAEAQATYDAASAAMQLAELNLERTQIRAPYAGRVRAKMADVGQYVNPGSPIAQIYAVDWAEVRLPLPDEELAFLNVPMHFRGNLNGEMGPEVVLYGNFAGQKYQWRGHITRLEGEIDARSRMVYAVARVENPYGKSQTNRPPLAVGMFVHAEITGHKIESIISIPRAAIRSDGRVLVVDADQQLRFREIDVLRTTDDTAYVQGGLQADETLCLSPLESVVDGMRIRIAASDEKSKKDASEEVAE